jgi:hypothetical protein
MEKYIQYLRSEIAKLSKQRNVEFVIKEHENSVSVECDITKKAKRIIGEKVVVKAVQHVTTEYFLSDDIQEGIQQLMDSVKEYIEGEIDAREINPDDRGVTITFASGNVINFNCSEWGSIERVKEGD